MRRNKSSKVATNAIWAVPGPGLRFAARTEGLHARPCRFDSACVGVAWGLEYWSFS